MMDERLLRFFKLVNFNDIITFEDATLKEMVVNRRENTWTLRINAKNIIPIKAMINLKKLCADGVDDVKKINIEMYYENINSDDVLEEEIIFADIFSATIEIVFTEKRENGLSTTVTYDLSVVNPGTIYGFNDLGETGAPYWVRAQAGQYTDPEKYQVPTLTMNEDANFVHDIDGKSFKVEIQGKEGMSNSNSWPRIDTSDISLPNLSEYEYLVAWIYNDSPDYKNITVHIQLNGSNSYDANVVCKRGEWTKLKISIKQLTSETGSSLVKKIAFWVSGFEDGSIVYYVDDLYLE